MSVQKHAFYQFWLHPFNHFRQWVLAAKLECPFVLLYSWVSFSCKAWRSFCVIIIMSVFQLQSSKPIIIFLWWCFITKLANKVFVVWLVDSGICFELWAFESSWYRNSLTKTSHQTMMISLYPTTYIKCFSTCLFTISHFFFTWKLFFREIWNQTFVRLLTKVWQKSD